MEFQRPRPVWVSHTAQSERPGVPRVGLLLEWRRVDDRRGVAQWWGLVAEARGGGEMPWHLELHWVWQVNLAPMDVAAPADFRRPRGR